MQYQTFDYRNGKYQGPMNAQNQRHGVGIFIDDDLTFYLSSWKQNKLNGPTLIYISHGKYIYGQWKDNQLSGLSVFRCGDTVLIGNFKNNFPSNRCFVIFERFNFACVLQQKSQEWKIVLSSELRSHSMLLKMIEKTGFSVPQHYYSLTKFVCNSTINHHYLKAFPCFIGCCYFGFFNGLGMVFNANNGLVSIGQHTGQRLTQFGGRFDNSKTGCEGNFCTKDQRISYSGNRPVKQIYNIFQRIHMQSLNFVNQYFDFKLKVFNNIETFIRQKIQIILQECKNKFNVDTADLNQSLDYQEYTEQQSFKLNSMRDAVYEGKSKESQNVNKGQVSISTFNPFDKIQGNISIQQQHSKQQISSKAFQKSKVKIQVSKHHKKLEEPQIEEKVVEQQNQPVKVYAARKSPLRVFKDSTIKKQQSELKHLMNNQIQAQQQKKRLDKSDLRDKQSARNRQKMKPNNHVYMQNLPCKQQNPFKKVSTPKNNNVYKEATKRQQQSPVKYRIPTFKTYQEQNISTKGKQTKNQFEKVEVESKSRNSVYRHNEVYQPAKPSYQDIQQRKRRILESYKNNYPSPKSNLNTISNFGAVCQFNSPTEGLPNPYSSPKQEQQGSFGVFPLSIFSKRDQKEAKSQQQNFKAIVSEHNEIKRQIEQKKTNKFKKNEYNDKAYLQYLKKQVQNENKNRAYTGNTKLNQENIVIKNNQTKNQKGNQAIKIKAQTLSTLQSNTHQRLSPRRPKKSYQYICQ